MRRTLRKTVETSAREFMTRLVEINQYLKEFPPFAENQALPEDEILDIAEFAIPATWQKTMVLQGFDPTTHSINEFIEFCERLEFAEGFQPNSKTSETKSQADPSGSSTGALMRPAKSSVRGNNKKKRKNPDETGKFCILHQVSDHDSSECKVLNEQARRMHATWDSHRNSYGRNYKQQNPNSGTKNKKQRTEESNTIENDMFMEQKVRKILSEMTKMKKKDDNENFNLDEFGELNLSETENEGEE
jgi:hypothetical protein